MLYIGEYDTLPIGSTRDLFPGKEPIEIVNLSSFIEGFPKLKLMPPLSLAPNIENNEYEFDMKYAEWVLTNDLNFASLYIDILKPLSLGSSVYIIIQKGDPYAELTAESLMKFIQQRYGYNYYIINDRSDIEVIQDNGRFNIQGIYNLDQDRIRMEHLAIKYRDINILR